MNEISVASLDELQHLKAKVKWMDVLMKQNAALEGEVSRLCGELDEATRGVLKRGYLYKYRDRSISFASHWGLRYFVLQGKTISYYADERDNRPRRTIDLSNCIVRPEGTKKGGTYFVIAIYLASEGLRSSESLLLRLSTESGVEKTQWVDMLEQACALSHLEDGQEDISSGPSLGVSTWKDSNPDIKKLNNQSKDAFSDGTIMLSVPLKRIDTDHPEEEEWGNSPIDADYDFDQELAGTESLSAQMIQRVKSSNLMLKKSFSRTLMSKNHLHSPSKANGSNEKEANFSKVDDKKGVALSKIPKNKSFPGFKPMHTSAKSSPLSYDVGPGEQNYRGFFNLGLIIMFLSHFRLVGSNLKQHGILFFPTLSPVSNFASPQVLLTLGSWLWTLYSTFLIEKLIILSKVEAPKITLLINFINGAVNLLIPCIWSWRSASNPLFTMIYLFNSVIIFMKIVSYSHANRDLRKAFYINIKENEDKKNGANITDSSISRSKSGTKSGDDNGKPFLTNIYTEASDLESPYLQYPENITAQNLLYFVFIPSLTYQLNYPRNKKIRKRYLLTILLRMLVVFMLIVLTYKQYIRPVLIQSNTGAITISQMLENVLVLSIPNTYIWLLGFYFYFHLYLNLFAELTRFGDRVFYRDWWNARTIESYWRNWNIPVHCWMLRHLYYPLTNLGLSKSVSSLIVFAVSAALHELVISIPMGTVSFHAFFGMLAQVPLIFITKGIDKRFDNPFLGNIIFWMVFCVVGQPMGFLLYSFDVWKLHQPV